MVSAKMMMVMPLIIFSAISLSVFAGVFISLMNRCMANSLDLDPEFANTAHKNKTALLAMTLLGAGEIFGGLIVGRIRDTKGNRIALLSEMCLLAIGIGMVIWLNESNKFNWVAYMMTFFWGLQDAGLNCFINCVLGFEFESKLTPFAVYKFSQSFFIFAFTLVLIPVMADVCVIKGQTDCAALDYSAMQGNLRIYLIGATVFGYISLFMMLGFKYKVADPVKDDKKGESEKVNFDN